MPLLFGPIGPPPDRRKTRSLDRLPVELRAHNDDPHGGAWTGYDNIVAQLEHGVKMASGVGVEPSDAWQYSRYHWMQQRFIELNADRRPPGKLGNCGLHIHAEVRS